jgi:hypothetical protein
MTPARKERVTRALVKAGAVFGVPINVILGPCREQHIVEARHVAIYVLLRHGFTLSELAVAFNRNHATVLYARKMIEKRLAGSEKARLKPQIDAIEEVLDVKGEMVVNVWDRLIGIVDRLERHSATLEQAFTRLARLEKVEALLSAWLEHQEYGNLVSRHTRGGRRETQVPDAREAPARRDHPSGRHHQQGRP